jgi:hypothetical protein
VVVVVVVVVLLLDCSCISKLLSTLSVVVYIFADASSVCGLFTIPTDATRLFRMWGCR